MNIQEAIKHEDDVAKKCDNKECGKDHKQLAMWLKELVALREKNLWHDAQGDDLPKIDREVIVLCNDNHGGYKVCFGHRPYKKGYLGKNLTTGNIEVYYYPEIYGKGGWNIPDVRWWLDVSIPNLEE